MSDAETDDSYRENYARLGAALDKILEIDGVDFETDIDVEGCYRSDDFTMATVTLAIDDDVLEEVKD